jgi:hypothetical protein
MVLQLDLKQAAYQLAAISEQRWPRRFSKTGVNFLKDPSDRFRILVAENYEGVANGQRKLEQRYASGNYWCWNGGPEHGS